MLQRRIGNKAGISAVQAVAEQMRKLKEPGGIMGHTAVVAPEVVGRCDKIAMASLPCFPDMVVG